MRTLNQWLPLALLTLAVPAPVTAQDEIDDAITALLAGMSLEEKAGQMTQLTLGAVSRAEASPANPDGHQLDMEKLRHAIVEKHVGSILNVHGMTSCSAQYAA